MKVIVLSYKLHIFMNVPDNLTTCFLLNKIIIYHGEKKNHYPPFLEVVKDVTLPAGVAFDHGVGGEELQGHSHSTQRSPWP